VTSLVNSPTSSSASVSSNPETRTAAKVSGISSFNASASIATSFNAFAAARNVGTSASNVALNDDPSTHAIANTSPSVNCGDRNVVDCALFEEDGAGFLDFDGTEITPFLFPLDFSFGLSELICIVSLFRTRSPPPESFSVTTTTEGDANDDDDADDALAVLTPLLDNDDLEDTSARAMILLLVLAGVVIVDRILYLLLDLRAFFFLKKVKKKRTRDGERHYGF
jgi:hypothetical protein